MAKGYKNPDLPPTKFVEARQAEYTTTGGLKIILTGLPPLTIPRIAASIIFPPKPTYKIKTASGDEEEHEHEVVIIPATEDRPEETVSTLQTDEDRKAWEKYLIDTEEAENLLSGKMIRAVVIEGIVLDDSALKDAQRWLKRQELMGIPVSTDPEERMLHYKETVVCHSAEDLTRITSIVMKLTGVDEEAVKAAKKSFQNRLESETQS